MTRIPIFDSLTHPMPNKAWIDNKYAGLNGIEQQLKSMHQHQIAWGLAVGLGTSIGGYTEDSYAQYIKQHADNLYPVVFFDFATINGLSDVDAYIIKLKNLGYIAIKIHPRIANIAFDHPLLKEAIVAANRHGLGVLLCTYFWNACGLATNIEELVKLLVQVPDQKIVLLHGGAVRLKVNAKPVKH